MKKIIILLAFFAGVLTASAQRVTDKLDRGLIIVPGHDGGELVSWRVFGEEYYDTKYNVYRNGTKIASNLDASNYLDSKGSSSSSYQVSAVVRGVEQAKCAAVKPWSEQRKTINLTTPKNRNGKDDGSNYSVNDVSLGDVNGDGITELLVKRPCSVATDPTQSINFNHLDMYDINGNLLWWIDLGPNMLAGPDEQWDAVMYDWDEDGKAEVILRTEDNSIIHCADGSTVEVGDMTLDTRYSGIEYTHEGNEFLLYLNGATGKPYQIGPEDHPDYMDYPNPRGVLSEWGDTYGHRSTKHYFGAPYLDGRHASIFLGRGCYTKHYMKAFDVDHSTHKLTQRWAWETTKTSSPWYGQGYHNFAIGDVDWDGRDEIIFGSMVIDDNGKGLSTTGLGHGDSQHCSDFDPYREGEEQFACNEDSPAMNYRNATTSELYYRKTASGDDGRALMGNFTNLYPGSVGRSTTTGWIGSCADKQIDALGGDALINWADLNSRIYWDGDLCDEYMDSPGTAGSAVVYKPGTGARLLAAGAGGLNNSSKNNPGAQADILGDWREELVLRGGINSLVIAATNYTTSYRIPTLWSDHQYRNAMVWQSMGYNQTPHKSYFLGELEGITQAPPTNTMTGRTEVANGGTITTTDDHLLVCETNNTNVSIADGASPYMVTFDVPSWVQGSGANNAASATPTITYTYYTCNVTGGAMTGATRVVKTGSGILTFPAVDMTYTGETNIWRGTFNLNGSLANSPVWLNRFAKLNTPASATVKSLKADYGAVVNVAGEDAQGTLTATDSIYAGFGSRLSFDIYSDGFKADQINTAKLTIEKKDWEYGPKYNMPVFAFNCHPAAGADNIAAGTYNLGHVGAVSGDISNIKIEGISKLKSELSVDASGNLLLVVEGVRDAGEIAWNGNLSSIWDYANTENFMTNDATRASEIFVKGDKVIFGDGASNLKITLADGAELPADSIIVTGSKNFTVSGNGKITEGTFFMNGYGTFTMGGDNTYTGGNHFTSGTVKVSSLASSTQAYGNLGGITTNSNFFTMENQAILQTTAEVKLGSPIRMIGEGGIINNSALFTMEKSIFGGTGVVGDSLRYIGKLTKRGSGTFDFQGSSLAPSRLIVEAGTFASNINFKDTLELRKTGGASGTGFISCPVFVAANATNSKLTTVNRQTSSNAFAGTGKVTVYCATEKGTTYYATRTPLIFDLTKFAGTMICGATYNVDGGKVFTLNTDKGSDAWTLNIPTGFSVYNYGKTLRIGNVTGSGVLAGSDDFGSGTSSTVNNWQVGNAKDFEFGGGVIGNAKFTKMGTGVMTVYNTDALWTSTGAIAIDEGTLFVKSGTKLGTGAITVAEGARLIGFSAYFTDGIASAKQTNSIYNVNGTLQAGIMADNSTTGIFNLGAKNVNINATGKIVAGLQGGATGTTLDDINNTYLYNINKLTMKDGATLELYLGSNYVAPTSEEKVDSFFIFNAKSVAIGNINYVLPDLSGYSVHNYWDTSKFSSKGVIYVRYDESYTGVSGIASEDAGSVKTIVATADGKVVANFSCPSSLVKSRFYGLPLAKGIYVISTTKGDGKSNSYTLIR